MINSLALVNSSAKIAKNVTIDAFSSIHKDVEIGSGTWIGSNVTIMDGARIGENCRIFPGAVISAIPQDLKFNGEESLVTIGNNTTIRECVTINRGTKASGITIIGNDCLIMAYVHIAHDCCLGNNCVIVNNVALGGHVLIGDYAIIGGLSAVHQFVSIGKHAMISGGALVRKDVPPFVKVAKEPLSFLGINALGLRRRGFSSDKISEIQEIYRQIFQKNNNISQALKIIKSEFKVSNERDLIIDFIEQSDRGIIKKPQN